MTSRKTIGRKLVVLVLSALATSFFTTAGLSTVIEARRQADLEVERLTQAARVIGSLSAEAIRERDRRGAFEGVRSIRQMPDVTYARIETPDGAVLAETGGGLRLSRDAQVREGERPSLWAILTTDSLQARAPVISHGEQVGEIVLFSRAPGVRERILFALWISLAGAAVALLAGLAVAMRLTRRISGPIGALAAHMDQVQATHDYSRPADIRADGEVAELVQGFNALLAGVLDRDVRIARQVENLEDEVAARTIDLARARDVAESANAAKSDFLAVMSHEIRTPLNGILSLSDMLTRANLPARQRRHAEVIAKSGRLLLGVINDILDFSKVEAGKMEMEILPVDLAEVAEDVASLFMERARGKGLDLAVYVDPRLPEVSADSVRLRQVISNLVNNAVKFTECGGVLIRVESDPTAPDHVLFTVEDTGPGIPADRLPTLFEAFTQADQSTTRRFGGTGLGLAICDRLVRAMGGEWRLESEIGRGSRFAFSAPFHVAGEVQPIADLSGLTVAVGDVGAMSAEALSLYLAAFGVRRAEPANARLMFGPGPAAMSNNAVRIALDEEDAAADALLPRPLSRADLVSVLEQVSQGRAPRLDAVMEQAADDFPRFPEARVLVVDDSDVNREVAAESLSQLDVQVTLAEDGGAAIALMRVEAFDLVFMDGSMPGLDGFETTARIRAEEAQAGRPRTAILALTAHVIGAGADAWREAGMDGVVHKPFTVRDLAEALQRTCAHRAVTAPPSPPHTHQADADAVLFDPRVRADLDAIAIRKPEFLDRVQSLYRANAPLRAREIDAALRAGDLDAVARTAHALKSMSLSLGARAVADVASMVEAQARSGGTGPDVPMKALQDVLARTMTALFADAPPNDAIESAIEQALADGGLKLVYQPIVGRNGAACGKVEALIRWDHPTRGPLSPDDFLPAVTSSGLGPRVTDFVLARAMRDFAAPSAMRVAVNVFPEEFQDPGFADRVAAALKAGKFPADRLEIEVTETAMLEVARAAVTIAALKDLGVRVALDDFGAGYTSFHALRDLPFDTLKIDRSFVDSCLVDTSSAAIIHAVISVGRALGMTVTCEGVETAEQAAFLRTAGAHHLQGYHFHRPLPPEVIVKLADVAA
ncbi:MAG: EAL domain-containing protein [Brevundimonas sp.]|uniref:EAL domain-containing protein n=1 Tax=Brevundimonas sp. TaxID=1871086 RepID=UPI00391D6280